MSQPRIFRRAQPRARVAPAPAAEAAPFVLDRWLDERRPRVEAALSQLLDATGAPEPLAGAMRYAALGPGKRLRPLLVMAAAEAVAGREVDAALPLGCAVELVHAYSLVHDDQPAMDDDDLRRGRLTVHKAYDEATAILVGDALQTLAFETIAGAKLSGRRRALAVAALARGAGARGMVGGQMLDLAAEGRYGNATTDAAALERLASAKTGALIAAAAELGAIAGGAGPKTRGALARYGAAVGLAFQVADDLLDATGSAEEVGKKTGKDAAKGKVTFPGLLGIDGARAKADALATESTRIAHRFSNAGGYALAGIAEWAARRTK